MQLSLPLESTTSPAPQPPDAPLSSQQLKGSWCGGERFVIRREEEGPVPAHVWFHFFDDGCASFTVRYLEEQPPLMTSGSWQLEGDHLVVKLGHGEVRAIAKLQDGLLNWAGEVLLRVPDGLTAFPTLMMQQ
jgi:hypothetical protein